jgi:creatinine amidohydrolase
VTARLGDLTWPEADGHAGALLVVPVGSVEQHGPHLPVDTDTVIAEAVAATAADGLAGVVLAPAIAYGASGEHRGFPGTVSIGTEALAAVLVELARSALPPFAAMVVVNGHGGNHDALAAASAVCRREDRAVTVWSPRVPGGDGHAGRTETSLMLAARPERVRLDRLQAGNTTPLAELLPALRRDGVRAHSPSGVLGDPTAATAEHGAELLAALVADLRAILLAGADQRGGGDG